MKNILLALSLAGLGSLLSAPTFAQTVVSGSSTIVLMNGASQSVGAELQISEGLTFRGIGGTGAIRVRPRLELNGNNRRLAINGQSIRFLRINARRPTAAVTSANPTSFSAAAARALDSATTLEAQVSIIRAGAGVDGLE